MSKFENVYLSKVMLFLVMFAFGQMTSPGELSVARADAQESEEDGADQIAEHDANSFSLGSRGDVVLNDGPGLLNYLKPFVQYRYIGEGVPHWSLELMTAYKQNRLVLKNQFHSDWAWVLRGDVEIANDGDSPSVRGEDLKEFEFKAHTYRGMAGLEWKDEIKDLPLHAQLMGSSRYYDIYSKSDSTTLFTNPKNFYENILHLRLDTGNPVSGTELADFGFRTTSNAAVFNRLKVNMWGPVGARRKVENFGRASVGARLAHRFWGPLVLVSGVQGSSTIGLVDRLNTIRSAQFAQRDESLFVSSVRAVRVVSGDLGVRIYFEEKGYFAVRPFVYGEAYRELLPTNVQRNDAAIGGGLKLMGRIGKVLTTDLTYALGRGNRPDLPTIHQVKYSLVARF